MFLFYSGSHSHTRTVPASCVFTQWIHTKPTGTFEWYKSRKHSDSDSDSESLVTVTFLLLMCVFVYLYVFISLSMGRFFISVLIVLDLNIKTR